MLKNKKLKFSGNITSKILGVTSLVLATIVTVYASFWGAVLSTGSVIRKGNGIILGNGTVSTITKRVGAFSPYLLIFVLLSIIGVVAIYKQNKKILWTTVIIMFLFSILLIFSYGLLFSPSLIFLIAAAIILNKIKVKT